MKPETKNLIILVLIVMTIATAFVPDPLAQTISTFLTGLTVLVAVALAGTGVTELLKIFLRYVFSVVTLPSWLMSPGSPKGIGSAFIAAVVAFVGVVVGNVDFLKDYPLFQNVDSNLVELITFSLVWFGSSLWHNVLPSMAGKYETPKPG